MKPHNKVFVRLGRSKIHGIGVIAIRKIPKGINVFEPAALQKMTKINKKDIENIPISLRKLYIDFCIWKNDILYCPENFLDMNITWYLNHSEKPNILADTTHTLRFIAAREIKKGEELLVNYDTYSDRSYLFT